MQFSDNYSVTRLFLDKKIKVIADNNYLFTIKAKTIRDIMTDDHWSICYSIIAANDLSKIIKLEDVQIQNTLDFVKVIVFGLGAFDAFRSIYNIFLEQLPSIFEEELVFDQEDRELKINDITITPEIWDYIIYLLKLICGEKVIKPLTFDSEEARQFFLAQQKLEQKINRTREKGKKDSGDDERDNLMKVLLSITYAFPSLTFDYLFDQTMAQIHWLQKYAAGAMSYEVNAKILAAGNMKKGSKLDFFIK